MKSSENGRNGAEISLARPRKYCYTSPSMVRIMIIAGETSGDLHGSLLVKELKALRPGLDIYGIGGDLMRAQGVELVYHIREFSFMGIVEVLGHLPFIRSVMLKGVGLAPVRSQVIALAIFAVSIMSLAVLRFRKRLD